MSTVRKTRVRSLRRPPLRGTAAAAHAEQSAADYHWPALPTLQLANTVNETKESLKNNNVFNILNIILDELNFEQLSDSMINNMHRLNNANDVPKPFVYRIRLSWSALCDLERVAAKPFVSLSLKLSETKFRPLLNHLLDWASGSEDKLCRLVTLFVALDALADKLASLVLIFAGPFVALAARLLPRLLEPRSNTENAQLIFTSLGQDVSAQMRRHLLVALLSFLERCFRNDNCRFANSERVALLSKPLTDQLTNVRIANYEQFYADSLKPCLISYALAITDSADRTALNQMLLALTQDSSPQVRLGVLKVLEVIYARLGDVVHQLIPETIPFVAELIEDENEEVEQQSQKVIKSLETATGESIQQFM